MQGAPSPDLKASLKASLVKFRHQVPPENGLLLEKNTQRKLKTNKRVLTAVKYADLPPRKKLKKDNTTNKENRKRKTKRQQGTPQGSCLSVPSLKLRLPQGLSNSTHYPKPSQSMLSKTKHSTFYISFATTPKGSDQDNIFNTCIHVKSVSLSPSPPQKAQTKTTDLQPASMPHSSVSPSPPL